MKEGKKLRSLKDGRCGKFGKLMNNYVWSKGSLECDPCTGEQTEGTFGLECYFILEVK